MNLLYITHLSGNMWAGPNNSVPAQIIAQSKIDNVFWYNLNYTSKKAWGKSGIFYNLSDYPKKSIYELPMPFSKPDLVIFEGIYEYPLSRIAKEIKTLEIPYILIPRSQLTGKAQKQKSIKKSLGNILYFNKFIRNADAIQYLTKNEFKDSGKKWNNNHLIIPNGITKKETIKRKDNQNRLKGIYIGRVETHQKGLDILIKACKEIREDLIKNNCTIDIYGPDRDNTKIKLQSMISRYGLENVMTINDGVFAKEKAEVQNDADFFVMTSRFEGHPMGLIEALSYGLPSLVTPGTNMSVEIATYNAGWVAEGKVESIKNKLLELLSEKESFSEKSDNAIELSKMYDWDKLANISHQKYLELLKRD